jgi:hypothetical protein
MATEFEHKGYFIEYMVGNKFMGTKNIAQPDRKEIGYYGRIDNVAENDIIFTNKKRIKKGQSYHTRMYPFCGKFINKNY